MTALIICAFGAAGIIFGELVCTAAYRIPAEIKTFALPRCAGCGRKLKWYECIPLFSYIFSGGKRRCCGEKISFARLFAPIACAALWIASALTFFEAYPFYSVLAALECTVLAAIAAIDFTHKWIPDRFQIALAVIGLATFLFDNPYTAAERLIGAAVGGGFFLLVYLGSLLIIKREGMGFGDVKLALCAGLFLGWQGMLLGLIIGSVSASVILLIIRAKTKAEKDTEYPFAPFLATGFAVAIFVTEICVTAYMRLF